MVRKIDYIDDIDRHIGIKIQELRLALGMSRQQLGEKIGVTHQQLQKYEKGTNRVSAGRLHVIAKWLRQSVQYFYEDIDITTDVANDDYSNSFDLSQHQRMCIEVSRNFMRIKNPEHKDAVNSLVRSLANDNANNEEGEVRQSETN